MRKLKNAMALGLGPLGQSAWEHKWVVVDFSHDIEAGALTIPKLAIVIPIPNTSLATGSQDNYPDVLAATSGTRQIGSGGAPLAILTGVFLIHFVPGSPPTVYQPVTTTFQVFVSSVVTTVGGNATALTAAFNASAAVNFIDQVAITAPTERKVTIAGETPIATAAQLFAGDAVYVSMVTAGALTPTGDVLAVALQFD
jgi:hypothetical protein